MRRLLLFLTIVLTTSCFSPGVREEPVPFVTLARGTYCDVTLPRDQVVRTKADLEKVWKKLNLSDQKLPDVNFENQTILAIFMGEQPTGGYSIRIDRISSTVDGLIVAVRRTEPPKGTPVTLSLTRPYIIVSVPRDDRPITFDYKTE